MALNCLDTYALMEITYGNENFLNLLDEEFAIPDLIAAEFYSVIRKKTQ